MVGHDHVLLFQLLMALMPVEFVRFGYLAVK
jgi:hypothetical protein